MIKVPVPEPPSSREEVIEILARGLCELVMRGCKPDRPRGERHPVLATRAIGPDRNPMERNGGRASGYCRLASLSNRCRYLSAYDR